MILANQPVSSLKGVGPKLSVALQQLGISNISDLLFHLPLRYEDRTRITPLSDLSIGEKVLVEGEIVTGQIQFGKRRSLLCRVQDGTGAIQLRFFHFNAQQSQKLCTAGIHLRCFGEVRQGYRGQLEMVHPEYRLQANMNELPVSQSLTPIYSTTQGLQQATWQKLIDQALALLRQAHAVDELLPLDLTPSFQAIGLNDALHYIHHPPADAPVDLLLQGKHPTQQRLAFEELVAHQLGLAQFRLQSRQRVAAKLSEKHALQQRLIQSLPFALTKAQVRVVDEINADLANDFPMLRLVQGDVGSGKTIVAALALLQAAEHGMQAAMMAPTELLAEQHYQSLRDWFLPLGITVGWLSGSQKDADRKAILAALKAKKIDIVVGTHALFQVQVEFAHLALLVVDEQHRFGVHQRLALKEKGVKQSLYPHQLIMTATPIPRTLAMVTTADLDVSVIDELPPGRKPIKTILISNQRRDEIINRVQINCHEGRQAYWVCTIIEDSEVLRAEAASATWQRLTDALPGLTIGLIHGRLKSVEKESIMAQFKAGVIDLLVATTVIEVGVDVPNASLMIIENAERLGLAQLHQLRGRVGRGQESSFCVLLYQQPLSATAKKRLQVMRDHQDGFYIAECDLEIRGPGELLGTRQTGLLRLRVADILRDQDLLPAVKKASEFIVNKQPELLEPLLARWLGGCQQYAEV